MTAGKEAATSLPGLTLTPMWSIRTMAEPIRSTRRGALLAVTAVTAAGISPAVAQPQAQSPIMPLVREAGLRLRAYDATFDDPAFAASEAAREKEAARRARLYADVVQRAALIPAASLTDIVAKLYLAFAEGLEDETGTISLSGAEIALYFSAWEDVRRMVPEVEAAMFSAA